MKRINVTGIKGIGLDQEGFTIAEILVTCVLLVIFFAGIGSLFFGSMPFTQRAYHADQMDKDAVMFFARLRQDMGKAIDVTSPAMSTSGQNCASFPINMTVDDGGSVKTVSYVVNSSRLQRCEDNSCEDLLSSWNDGHVQLGGGTRVCRGLDANGDGSYTLREEAMLRMELKLEQHEGPGQSSTKVFERIYYFDVLPNTEQQFRQ